MMFARGGSDDHGYDEYDDNPTYDDEAAQGTRRDPGAPHGSSGGSSSSGGSGGGRQRTVQFQPEERYWTEYLRIALPIVGLLLMIGLFWYWASQLAGDDNGPNEPISTETPGSTTLITPDSTPEPTEQVISQPTQEPTEPTMEEAASTPDTEEPEDEPTEEPDESEGEFSELQAVIVTDDGEGLNMRAEPSTSADSVGSLSAGTVLEIQSGPIEADGYIWWEVIVSDTGEAGFVAQRSVDNPDVNFIESAE
jgi:hypothetical protein